MSNRLPRAHVRRGRSRVWLGALAVPCLVALVIAGCGGSSSTNATSSASASAGASGPGGARFAKYRACLQAHGVTFPTRRPGTRPPGGGGGLFGGGGGAGGGRFANNPRLAAAMKACGVPTGGLGFRRRFSSPQYKAALTKFVACVHQHGYNLPTPNTSGTGPVFKSGQVNQRDPKFISAAKACAADLQALRGPGPGGPGGPGGGPPPPGSNG